MKIGRIEGTFKAFELYAGLSLTCFAAGTFLSWALMSRLLERPDLLPDVAARPLLVSLVHDAGYLVCAPAFAWAASRLVRGNPLLPAFILVPGNYLVEEIVVFIWGGERLYWSIPWGLAGRLIAAGAALALSLALARRNKPAE